MKGTPQERFWAKVDKSGTPEHPWCWIWTAACAGGQRRDYGYFRVAGRNFYAHRFAYETEIEPVPQGLELDHVCNNPKCVNPGHMEPVTHRENTRRAGAMKAAIAASVAARLAKTACPRGHSYAPTLERGARWCRVCKNDQQRERYRAKTKDRTK